MAEFDKSQIYLKSAIRKIWRWSKARRECLKAKTCAVCGTKAKLFADHIDPVVDPQKGFQGWDVYIKRMFDGKLQAVCKPCHAKKSKEENALRRKKGKKCSKNKG